MEKVKEKSEINLLEKSKKDYSSSITVEDTTVSEIYQYTYCDSGHLVQQLFELPDETVWCSQCKL